MSVKNRTWLLLMVITVVQTAGVCFGWKDEGFQYWPAVGVSYNINKDWQFNFEQEERFGDDGGNMYYEHSDFGLVRKNVTPWLDLGFYYREIYAKNSEDELKPEHRPYVDATVKTNYHGFDLSDRSRFEYRDLTDKMDVWRYRNKPMIKFPVELTSLKLQPFVADDMHISLRTGSFERNWFMTGFLFPISKNLKCEIYWLWQDDNKETHWEHVNALVTKFKFSF